MNRYLICRTSIVLLVILAYATAGSKLCPPEPQSDQPCPTICDSCDTLGRCIILNPLAVVVVAPDDRPTVLRCTDRFSCVDTDVICSANASCDVICVAGACQNLWLDCGNTNHSCSIYCERKETRLAGFVCNATSACNCQNTCGPTYVCTPGVSCRGDPCYRTWSAYDPCYPYRPTAAVLNYTFDSTIFAHCDCVCKNQSLVAFDEGGIVRYCIDPNALCQISAQCNHGICVHGQCECYNGWTGPYCDQVACSCGNGSFCGPNGQCVCTGGYSGFNCSTSAPCVLPAVIPPEICPLECHECIGDTCVIHVRPGATLHSFTSVTCPAAANQMRCLLLSDTSDSAGFNLFCSSEVACDLVCTGSAQCSQVNFICSVPGVPCRAHCTGATLDARAIGTWGCPNGGNNSCDFCDLGGCVPTSNCTVGLDCPDDPCFGWPCYGGTVSKTPFGFCVCLCPVGTFEAKNAIGESTCLATDESLGCACLDYGNVCINGTCICSAALIGSTCDTTPLNCPAPNTPALPGYRPAVCDIWDAENNTCTIINPVSKTVACPFGYQCVVKCYAGFCNGLTVFCDNGAGPCDLYCLGQQACLMASIKCATMQPCNSHCSSGSPAKDQVLAEHICDPLGDIFSCSCNSSCLLQANVQNPCYLVEGYVRTYGTGEMGMNHLFPCSYDNTGVQLVPVPSADRSTCICSCPQGYFLNQNDNLCLPNCDPDCQNGGQCIVDKKQASNRRCLCFSGWTGSVCTLRCFFPIPVEIISCDNGVYVIANNMTVRSNETLLVLQDTPDAQVIFVNGTVLIQPNATISLASNASVLLQVLVGGDMTQSSGSILQISIVTMNANGTTAIGSNITIAGSARLSGTLQVSVGANLLPHLQSGTTIVFPAMQYGQAFGQFDTVNVSMPSFSSLLPDSCTKINTQTQYESHQLNLIFSLDKSRCSPPELAGPAAASSHVGAIAGGVVGAVVAVAAVAAIVVFSVPSLRHKIMPYNSRRPDAASVDLPVIEEPSATRPTNKSSWQRTEATGKSQ